MSQDQEGSQSPTPTSSPSSTLVPKPGTSSEPVPSQPTADGSTLPPIQIFLPSQNTVAPLAATAAALESQLQEERRDRKIERFFWIFLLVTLTVSVSMIVLPWYASLFLVLMAVTGLIGCANWLEVPWVVKNLERIFDKFHGAKGDVEPLEKPKKAATDSYKSPPPPDETNEGQA